MSFNINQSDIFPLIIKSRCGDDDASNNLWEKTGNYLDSIISTYAIPTEYTKEQIITAVLHRIFANINTYNPNVNTYLSWITDIFTNFYTYLQNKDNNEQNYLNWKWEFDDTPQKKSISKLDPYNSAYLKFLRRLTYQAAAKIEDENNRKALLLSFQNPLDQIYWANIFEIDETTFRHNLINGIKELKTIIFEQENFSDLAEIVKFITEDLSYRLYFTQSEIDKLQDPHMQKTLINAVLFETPLHAAADTGYEVEKYETFLLESIIELSKMNKPQDSPQISTSKNNLNNIEKQIFDYLNSLLQYGIEQTNIFITSSSSKEFNNYKILLDFMYLLFAAQSRPPTMTELLTFSVNSNASDLHISAGLPPMVRIDGDIRRINIPPMEQKIVKRLIYEIMNERQRKKYEETLDIDFSFELEGTARFRINAFNHIRGSGAAFRTIPKKLLTLAQIGVAETLKNISDSSHGLILVTGPTGSGKSTTLAAMIDYRNNKDYANILTIEDPVEYLHQSKKCLINQREVHRNTLGFSEALRAALREDPDIILVGEMRDLETIRLALTAAETGHLVFATLHTNTAPKAIDRIIDVFPANEKAMMRFMLAESLRAVISQTLIKKIGGGRVATLEIMIANPAIRNIIREDKLPQIYSTMQLAQSEGMQTFDQHLQQLCEDGIIKQEDALFKARSKNQFSKQTKNL